MDEQSTLIEGLELTAAGGDRRGRRGHRVCRHGDRLRSRPGCSTSTCCRPASSPSCCSWWRSPAVVTEAVVTRVVESAERMCRYTADGHRAVRGWVKASARWSNHQARIHADVARLIRHHELCRDEYFAGRLGLAQIALLARLACHPRAGKHFAGSEKLLVEDAQRLEYEDFRKVCDHWLNLADLDGADQDEAIRHYLRNGCCITTSDGMTHLDAQFAGAQGTVDQRGLRPLLPDRNPRRLGRGTPRARADGIDR